MAGFQTGFNTRLAARLAPADVTATLTTAPTPTSGRMLLINGNITEWISYTGVSGSTITGLTRNLSTTANPATGGTGLDWGAGSQILMVAMHDQIVDKETALPIVSYTTTQRDALDMTQDYFTGSYPIIYNTTAGQYQYYNGSAWASFATGTVADASTTVGGKVKTSVAPTGTGTALITDDDKYKALAGQGTPSLTNLFESQYDTSNGSTKTATTISFTSGTKTIADSGNGLVTAGFKQGTQITITGSASNNSTFTIVSVAAGAIVVAESIVTEAAGASVTITTVTINKIARYDSNGDLIVPATPTSNNAAASKSWVTSQIPTTDTSFFLGAGAATNSKLYYNYQIPFTLAAATTTAIWAITNGTLSSQYSYGTVAIGAGGVVLSATLRADGVGTALSASNTVIAEFACKVNSTGTNDMCWALGDSGGAQNVYNSAANDMAGFTISPAGNLYAKTSNGSGGANHTETQITGITLTNVNYYRIEFIPSTSATFYVNGVLKATITTTLPDTSFTTIFFGSQNTTNYPNAMSLINVSVLK